MVDISEVTVASLNMYQGINVIDEASRPLVILSTMVSLSLKQFTLIWM